MRILFTVQGEGRGHLTQAIAAWEMLSRWGHELVGVVAGRNGTRELPAFFTGAFPVTITRIASPGFTFAGHRGVDMPATLWRAAARSATWRASLRQLEDLVSATRPDLVVNFFEPLTGLLQAIRPLRAPVLAVAHQFALLGPRWTGLRGHPAAPWWLRRYIQLVGWRSLKLALSFVSPATAARGDVRVVPPLLREQVRRLEPSSSDYLLVYLLNHGYAESVRRWHRRHPDVRLHCFYDLPGAPAERAETPQLTFHRLDGEKFLRLMAGCRAVVCTAGFESVCEAAFLGKPVLMIPVEGHLEQRLNARGGEVAGLGLSHPRFDLDALDRLRPDGDTAGFRAWCLESEVALLRAVHHLVPATILAGPPEVAPAV